MRTASKRCKTMKWLMVVHLAAWVAFAAVGDIEIVARGHYGHHPHGLEIDEQQKFVDFFNGGK